MFACRVLQSIHREYERQREYLHRRIFMMKKQLVDEGNEYSAELSRVMQVSPA